MGMTNGNFRDGLNIEIKARSDDLASIRRYLNEHDAEFIGLDYQKDIYFKVSYGRLKIRNGNVESCVVFYDRETIAGPKKCCYKIIHFEPGDPVITQFIELFSVSLGILCTVIKKREIYFIDNVKFHLDEVDGLGTFFEIEAINSEGIGEAKLRKQCKMYLNQFEIIPEQLVKASYCDMLL
ncbi:MAG: CYTH domain-containing protein [Candidatus Latescibacteria bacterium]|nr:CYTH domain-containing protein [Candidatus Latescibacterota bacterium]